MKLEDLCRPQRQRRIHTDLIQQLKQTNFRLDRNERKEKGEHIISDRGEERAINKRQRIEETCALRVRIGQGEH